MLKFFLIITVLFISSEIKASTLSDLIQTYWNEDALIRAQKKKIASAELDRFARFLPNNPQISYADSDNKSWKTYGVSVNFGLPGKAFAMNKLDNEVIKIENAELAAKKNELARFVLGYFSDCAGSLEILNVLEEATDELATLERTITARYESGQSTQSERLGIQLQLRQARIELGVAKDKSAISCIKLKELTSSCESGNCKSFKESDFVLPDDLEATLVSELGSISPEVIRSNNEMKLANVRQSVATWENLPELSIGVYRNYYNKVAASPIIPTQWTTTYLFSINFPLFYPFYNGNDVRKIRADSMIAERRAYMGKISSEKEMEIAAKNFRRNKQVLEKLRSHDMPMAEVMVDSTFASYKAGKLGFSELILAKRTWLDLKKEEVNLKISLLTDRLTCLNSCELE